MFKPGAPLGFSAASIGARRDSKLITSTCLDLDANDRFGYGAMTRDSVKFKSLAGWFYCAKRKEFLRI